MKRILAVSCVVFHHFHPSVAFGCGATPDMFLPLMPAAEATEVPLDAALFIASNDAEPIAFTLRREGVANEELLALVSFDAGVSANSGETAERAAPPRDIETAVQVTTGADGTGDFGTDADDVGVDLPLVTTCHPAVGGNLCIAKPEAPLTPGAAYSWTASKAQRGGEPGATTSIERQWFRAGDAVANVGTPKVSVEVVTHLTFTSHPCGLTGAVGLSVTATGIVTPLLVNAKGLTPSYVSEPVVLSAEHPQQAFGLYGRPECFVMEAFDVTGARFEIGETCPEQELPATPDVAPPPAASMEPGSSTPAEPAKTAAAEPGLTEVATSAGEQVPAVDIGALPPAAAVQQRGVDSNSNGGCAVVASAVAPNDVGRSLSAAAWLAALGVVVGLRRMGRA